MGNAETPDTIHTERFATDVKGIEIFSPASQHHLWYWAIFTET